MPRAELTPKQALFVAEYLRDHNATQAARRAGYSERSCGRFAQELLAKPHIAATIAAGVQKQVKRVEISADRVLRELAIIGFSDVRDFVVSDDGRLTLADGARKNAWRAVSSVKHKIQTSPSGAVDRSVEIRLWDKNTALEKIAKRITFYPAEEKGSGISPEDHARAVREHLRLINDVDGTGE